MGKNLFLFVIAIFLAGCSGIGQGPFGGHSKQWYLRNQKKMHEEITWCGQKPSRASLHSCKNAAAASNEELEYNAKRTLDSLRNDF